MQVSLLWLKEYLDLKHTPEEIADAMTLAGLETEGMREVEGDVIFEIGLTPNLGHCMSVIGIARELAAILQIPLKRKELFLQELGGSIPIQVQIEDKEDCLQYSSRLVQSVKVGPSPEWLVKKLESVGHRTINNVVDIGNLVMLECGQPLHMFDNDLLTANQIVVRKAKNDGKMVTIDEVEREIPDGVLLICDKDRPVAFAGVMGGLETSITEKTKDVLIEAAEFAPSSVRKTSKLLNLRSDSSGRFERGIDPLGVRIGLDMAAAYLSDLAEGVTCKGVAEEVVKKYKPHIIDLDPEQANRILGINLSVHEICELLGRLEIEILSDSKDKIIAAVPSYRGDLRSEIDLIEEIGRMYGFNNIPRRLPRHVSSTITHSPLFVFEEKTRDHLTGEGLQEFLTCDLISPKLADISLENSMDADSQIHVLHPASVDQSVLRSSLLPGLLQVVKFNLDRQNENIAAFEVGRIHFKSEGQYFGEPAAGIILTGKQHPYHFEAKPNDVDFFTLKGQVENFLSSFRVEDYFFESSHLHNFHPGRQAYIKVGEIILGALGEIHPSHLRQLEIGQRVYFTEINLHDLMDLVPSEFKAKTFSLFPGSIRDLTITIPEKIPLGEVLEEIQTVDSSLLEQVFLLDLYKSEKIGKDRKNITLRFKYRDPNKTIAYEEVEKEHTRLTELIAEKFAIV